MDMCNQLIEVERDEMWLCWKVFDIDIDLIFDCKEDVVRM